MSVSVLDTSADSSGGAAPIFALIIDGEPVVAEASCPGRLERGTAWVNPHGALHPLAPFGRVNHLGIGAEFNIDGLREYTTAQVVNVAR